MDNYRGGLALSRQWAYTVVRVAIGGKFLPTSTGTAHVKRPTQLAAVLDMHLVQQIITVVWKTTTRS